LAQGCEQGFSVAHAATLHECGCDEHPIHDGETSRFVEPVIGAVRASTKAIGTLNNLE
jgi:hypothetical protein